MFKTIVHSTSICTGLVSWTVVGFSSHAVKVMQMTATAQEKLAKMRRSQATLANVCLDKAMYLRPWMDVVSRNRCNMAFLEL